MIDAGQPIKSLIFLFYGRSPVMDLSFHMIGEAIETNDA